MYSSKEELLEGIKKEGVEYVDIRFCDLPGVMQHFSIPASAFDEDVFEDPYSFDILRDPNPHVGFGGTGAHYCIGTSLARMTIDLMFNAIADAMPDITSLAQPERLRSGWLNGIKHWQVDYVGASKQTAGR